MLRFRLSYLIIPCLFVLMTLGFSSVSQACTGMRVKAKDGSLVFARSMEFGTQTESDLMIAPRGMTWTSQAPDGSKGLHWKSKYAFVGPDGLTMKRPLEGINEKGLYVGGFWMPAGETTFPKLDPADYSKAVSQLDFVARLLSTCATVDEVRAEVSGMKLAGVEIKQLNLLPLAHWTALDSTGRMIAIESIGGKVAITDNPVGVFTNAPSFGWHLEHLRMYINLRPDNVDSARIGDYRMKPFGEGSGLIGLPGDLTPPSRFVRAAFYADSALTPADADGAVTLGMNLIAAFSIPTGVSRGTGSDGKPEYDFTQWTTVYDLSRKAVYFRAYDNQDYRKVRFDALPLDGTAPRFIPMWNVKPSYLDVSDQAKPAQ
ncbi:MAG: linear amide C-N hydrolase [Pseudodesulfovibrio sp.]|uniref:linear amide C-N hydrolase n=1 Tax=Pseudodesulfovibrio sp. TaxID=2035812 RepID=UPI003D0ECA65